MFAGGSQIRRAARALTLSNKPLAQRVLAAVREWRAALAHRDQWNDEFRGKAECIQRKLADHRIAPATIQHVDDVILEEIATDLLAFHDDMSAWEQRRPRVFFDWTALGPDAAGRLA